MLGAKRLLPDREGALVEWPCPRKVALGLEHAGKAVETCRSIGMFRAKRLFTDRQRALVERPCADEVALAPKQVGKVG
jgi:hypothetical protein